MSTRRGTVATDLEALTVRVEELEDNIGGGAVVPRTLELVDTVTEEDGVDGVLLANAFNLSTYLSLPAGGGIVTGTRQEIYGGSTGGVMVAAGSGATVVGAGLVPPGGMAKAVKSGTSTWQVGGTAPTHFTEAGTPYVEFRSRPTTGQDALVMVPTAAFRSTNVPVILVTHGVGSDAEMIAGTGDWATLREPMLDEGWVVCCSDAQGAAWGNAASQTDIIAMRTRVTEIMGSGPTVLVASSMGGLPSLSMIADGDLPNVVGWAGIAPVCSLADMYDGGSGGYADSIEAAYGIAADGSDYNAKTSGFDPLLRTASLYASKRYRFYASSGDTIVSKTDNSDAFAAHITSVATEATVVPVTGTHLSSAHYLPDDLIPFIQTCLA